MMKLDVHLEQKWGTFLTDRPQWTLKLDPESGEAADGWRILVTHLIECKTVSWDM